MSEYDLWVDFNGLSRDGRTTSLIEFWSDPDQALRAGLDIVVGDSEGNTCEARVEVIDGKRVGVVCNLDTFRGSTA